MRVRILLPALICLLSIFQAAAASGSSIEMTLQLSGTTNMVYIPGSGEISSANLGNNTYGTPEHSYLASYGSGILNSLVFSGSSFNSLKTARSGNMHTLGINMSLSGSRVLLAFTSGDWLTLNNRIKEIESGKFFSYPNPTFGFGLGSTFAIKLLLAYADIKTIGNLTLQAGRQGLTFSYNGTTTDNKQIILVTQAQAA